MKFLSLIFAVVFSYLFWMESNGPLIILYLFITIYTITVFVHYVRIGRLTEIKPKNTNNLYCKAVGTLSISANDNPDIITTEITCISQSFNGTKRKQDWVCELTKKAMLEALSAWPTINPKDIDIRLSSLKLVK
jgi:hypothetical protein